MRRTAAQARGRRQDALGVSLFPFLAVLICTMGALILLLVVIARQARLQAAQLVEAKTAEEESDLARKLEDVRWRIEQLEGSREGTASQLAETRLELGHVEDHARQLRRQLARLEAARAELEESQSGAADRYQLEAELRRLEGNVLSVESRLAETRRVAGRRRSYAVVPYQGPNTTHRRPIYIECRRQTVVLQPEGVTLEAADFDGPPGPDNPLAAALRAVREYLLTHGTIDGKEPGEPYPLLLVRPNGIAAYQAAREAMKSWGSDFGYELIGDDWELAFQPPKAELAELMQRQIESARQRRQRVIAAVPRRHKRRREQTYTVSPGRGGVVPYGGRNEDEDEDGEFHVRRPPDADAQQGDSNPRRPGRSEPNAPRVDAESSAGGESSHQIRNLAKIRGRNWGLPAAAAGSYPLERPVRIDCFKDRLVLVPEQGLSGGKTTVLGPRTEDSIDEFVSAVWTYMDSWGIAGRRMYWRATLNVHVAEDAERRFVDLKTLLEDSGLVVRRRN